MSLLHDSILADATKKVGDVVNGFQITKLDRAAKVVELELYVAPVDLSGYAKSADIPAFDRSDLLSGVGAPSNDLGIDSNFYEQVDAATGEFRLWGPKAGGVWPATAQYWPNTDYDTPITKNKADITALSARLDTIAVGSATLAFARAPIETDIYPYGKEWYDTRWGSANPLVWVSEGNGVWRTKNRITLTKIRLDYSGTRTSWTFFGGIRILKADGTQYTNIFNAGQSSGASGFPAAGQPYTGQSANPPVNGNAWLELIPRDGEELSGFSGIIANYRTGVWSTVVRKLTLTFSNGHTQVWNVNWDNANSNITNTVTGALPFPVGSIPNTAGIDAAIIAQFAPTNAAFAALQATVAANTPQPPFTQHDFGEIDPIPLSGQAVLAHLEGGGGYIIDATLFQDAHQATIINTTDAPQPIATMNFATVYIRDGAEQTIAPEPVIVPADMAALVSVTVNGGLSYLNISFVGREEVPPVDLTPVTEQIANHAADTGLHKTDLDRQKLGLIELIKSFSTARQAPPLPTLDGGTSSAPTFNIGRSALIDGEPYRINGTGSISYDFTLATIIGRRYQVRYAFRPPATGFVILRNNGNTVNYQFNAPEFNDVHPGITVTNDGSWITLTQEFVADSIEYSSRITTNGVSAAQGPVVLVESDAVLGEGGKKLLHEGDIVIPPQVELTDYAKKTDIPTDYLKTADAASTYQPKGFYALKSELPDMTGVNNSINTLAGQIGGMLPGPWMAGSDYYYHESVIWATIGGYTGVHIADWASHAADGDLRTSRPTFDATEQACWVPYVKAPSAGAVNLTAQNMGNFNPIGGTGVYAGMVHPRAGARVGSFTFTFRDNRTASFPTRTASCTMNLTGDITRFENSNRYGIYQEYNLGGNIYGALVQWLPLPGGSMGIYLQTTHSNTWNAYAEYLGFTVNWVAS